jgi:DNA polymerase-3 subunit epsilon
MRLNLKNPIVFFDLETTGIDLMNDRIVEYSFIKVMPNGEKEQITRRVNPMRPIPAKSTSIHGITDEDVKDLLPFKAHAKNLADFIVGCDLAGFNIIRFDIPMLVEEMLRAEVSFDVSKKKIIDLQRIYHMMEPRTLSAAYKFYCNTSLENAHSAAADTSACLDVLDAQIAMYENKEITDEVGNVTIPVKNDVEALHQLTLSNFYDLAGRMILNEKREVVFNFGKYKNQVVSEVLKKDPSYYDWMMKGEFALNTKQKLTEIKLSSLKNR